MRRSTIHVILTTSIIAIACALLLLPPLPILTLMADTEQYRWMSATVGSGTFFDRVDISQVPHLAAVMRPPLFPLLLAAAEGVPILLPSDSLVALHLCAALLLLVGAPLTLRHVYSPPVTAVATGLALYSAKQVFWGEMSEWLAMSFLLGATVAYLRWASRPTGGSAILVAALLSLAILTRVALLPFLVVLPALVWQSPRLLRKKVATSVALGLLPLGLWSAIQFHRVGAFTLGAYEGLNVLATIRSLQTLRPPTHSSPDTTAVIDFINERGITTGADSLRPNAVHTWDGNFYEAFHTNFDIVCEAVRTIAPSNPPAALSLAARTIWSQPGRYLEFLRGGVATFVDGYALPLLSCLLTAGWLTRRSRGPSPTTQVAVTMCAAACVYLVSIFATILWLHRYFIPVQSVIIFLTTLSFAGLLTTFRSSDATTKS